MPLDENEYVKIESYMLKQMQDSAHDRHHVYRVLNSALDIADSICMDDSDADANRTDDIDIVADTIQQDNIDTGVLIAACLLHDIGREAQYTNPELCHAEIGGDMAFGFLISIGWPEQKARHVKDCIISHRYRKDDAPQSIEAKILFDADKLDASGALGIARTLIYGGQVTEPLYILDERGNIVEDGGGGEISSFCQEYNYKLKNVYDSFHTERAKKIAMERQKTAINFYNGLFSEISFNYNNGINKHLSTFNK